MAYRVHAKFKDGSTSGPLADVVAAPPPQSGETICVTNQGRTVPMLVTAVWTPAAKIPGRTADALIMVEASEI